jgi:hypothetical protein
MFLNELNKKEATAFVSLVENLAKVDEVYSDCEKELISNYIEELSLTDEGRKVLTFESAVKELNDSTGRIQNIIYFELLGVALLDGLYENKELAFLNKLATNFNISKEKQKAYEGYFKKVKFAYDITASDSEAKIKEIEILVDKLLTE